ncbi:MAG TPA: pyruvate formate lyase family protein [Thermotogota bacterium]|nr:pyruvate formate lyase family protein [Thermotogota bacterium]
MKYEPREVRGNPSSKSVTVCYERYLSSPLFIDAEYMRFYTERHKEVSFWEEQERRAECHAYALERLTPVIQPDERIVGSKTRYTRGAIPYANYASEYILREFRKERHEAQDLVTDLGTGGGIARTVAYAEDHRYDVFCHKFLITPEDKRLLKEVAEYWKDRCMQAEGDRIWKAEYPHADWIQKGWETGLYTAPHDPAPEGRMILDFETALSAGINELIERCQNKIKETLAHPGRIGETKKAHFWRAAVRVLEATKRWVYRYGERAMQLASDESDLQRKRQLQTIAENCFSFGNVPATFYEAIQHFWFLYLAGHIEGAHLGYSVGRFDQYMNAFFREDRQKGILSDSETLELLEMLRIKHTEIEYVASFSWEGLGSGNLFQNMMLGGYTEKGLPADNELSTFLVQAAINVPTIQPTLSVWWTPALSPEFLMKCVACVKTGVGFPAWFNTDVYIKHELQRNPELGIGFIRKQAAMGGCTEPVLQGCSYGVVQPGFINHLKLLEYALFGGKDPKTGIEIDRTEEPTDAESLINAYKTYLGKAIQYWQEYWNLVMEAHSRTVPLIYCSALMQACIDRGKNMDHGGSLNNQTPTTLSSGLVNVVNSIAAIRTAENQGVALPQIKKWLMENWKGFEAERKMVLAAPKWGNDEEEADLLMQDLWDTYCEDVEKTENYLGKPYDPSMLAISTMTPFGKVCIASAEGRFDGEPLADGVTSPYPGTDRKGPMAVLRSVQKIDHTRIRGGLHNMKFHPSTLSGAGGSLKLLQMIRTYFETQTAFQIQFNVVDSRMLRDAQEHPENYRDLIVRVAGFSAYFVELQKSVQDQVIARTEQTL